MSYHCQDEVCRLIEQWARWPGFHGSNRTRSSIAWVDDLMAKRASIAGPEIPIMMGEAADTNAAMRRMSEELSEVLITHYLRIGTESTKVRDLNRRKPKNACICARTYRRRVAAAHVAFMGHYRDVVQSSHVVAIVNQRVTTAVRMA